MIGDLVRRPDTLEGEVVLIHPPRLPPERVECWRVAWEDAERKRILLVPDPESLLEDEE